jgi:hypothetical protein
MRVLVVYESMFGNTEAIARAIAEGLKERLYVVLHEVGKAPAIGEVDLIVAGGPTHAFSLSRQSTREDAIGQGATHGSKDIGVRDWLVNLPRASQPKPFAAFDTRIDKVRHLPGSAAAKVARIARHRGYASAGLRSFYVTGISGPLVDGELERARAWGVQLASQVSDRSAGRTLV